MTLPPATPDAGAPRPGEASGPLARLDALDMLATLVAVAAPDGALRFVNAAFEDATGVARRTLMRGNLLDWFFDAPAVRRRLEAVAGNDIATGRFDAQWRRAGAPDAVDSWPVHVIVTQIEHRADLVLVEMLPIEQQARQDREERSHSQQQANKELIRNLAHEIKNPLGGIRGAAQLLAMDATGPDTTEYTGIILHEVDRLQSLVDRFLAPHRRAPQVSDVNIHEVCERVRSLVLAEHARGLTVARDYDVSLPDFRGDREQLIQAVLNITRNAAQALQDRIAQGDARIVLRTRAARQVTIGKQRHRLALELHIEDNGPGVPEDIQDRLFYPLVSGREGGTGLGLTLALSFVQQHQGTIECDSRPGRTVFKVAIPLP